MPEVLEREPLGLAATAVPAVPAAKECRRGDRTTSHLNPKNSSLFVTGSSPRSIAS